MTPRATDSTGEWLGNYHGPDLSYAAKESSRALQSPTQDGYAKLNHAIPDIKGMENYRMTMRPEATTPTTACSVSLRSSTHIGQAALQRGIHDGRYYAVPGVWYAAYSITTTHALSRRLHILRRSRTIWFEFRHYRDLGRTTVPTGCNVKATGDATMCTDYSWKVDGLVTRGECHQSHTATSPIHPGLGVYRCGQTTEGPD